MVWEQGRYVPKVIFLWNKLMNQQLLNRMPTGTFSQSAPKMMSKCSHTRFHNGIFTLLCFVPVCSQKGDILQIGPIFSGYLIEAFGVSYFWHEGAVSFNPGCQCGGFLIGVFRKLLSVFLWWGLLKYQEKFLLGTKPFCLKKVYQKTSIYIEKINRYLDMMNHLTV